MLCEARGFTRVLLIFGRLQRLPQVAVTRDARERELERAREERRLQEASAKRRVPCIRPLAGAVRLVKLCS